MRNQWSLETLVVLLQCFYWVLCVCVCVCIRCVFFCLCHSGTTIPPPLMGVQLRSMHCSGAC